MTPRHLVHQGTVLAAGFLLDPDLLGLPALQRRALALWQPGARFCTTPAGKVVVVLPQPQTLACDAAPGLPLLRVQGHLVGLPLSAREWATLAPPPGSLIYPEGGSVVQVLLAELEPLSVTDWLELPDLHVRHTRPLLAPTPAKPDPIALVAPPPQPLARLVPPDLQVDAARQAVVHSLNQPRQDPLPAPPSQESGLERWGRVLLDRLGLRTSQGDTTHKSIREQLRSIRQHEQLKRQNADYLEKMLALFERGEWTQALQHAIPLGKAGEGDEAPSVFGRLAPRSELVIRPQAGQSSGALPWEGLYGSFQQLYRDSVERLKAEGRFEEAAFVLAELLRDDAEAVSFLERHGKLQLAAEMAEARNLAPGLVVRQWWLAGDKDRALRLARRAQCFSDAILRLERSQQATAAQGLRLEWAQLLAELGDYPRAVATVEQVPAARALARRWAELGVEIGGVAGAQLLHRLILWSETPDEVSPWIERAHVLLNEPGKEAAVQRHALLGALFPIGNTHPRLRPLLRLGLRKALEDHGAGYINLTPGTASSWAKWAEHPALDADLPSLLSQKRTLLQDTEKLIERRIEGEDVGTLVGLSAASLKSGRVLVALGESGVLLLHRDGRTLHRFDVPATALAVSEEGELAVALAPRDESQRVHVLHLGSRKVTDWGELPLLCWEPQFEAGIWHVARGDQLLDLDVLADTPIALRARPIPEPIVALSSDGAVLSANPLHEQAYWWRHDQPSAPQPMSLPGELCATTRLGVHWLYEDREATNLFSEGVVVLCGTDGGPVSTSVLGELDDTPIAIAACTVPSGELVLSALRDFLGVTVYASACHLRRYRPPLLALRLSGSQSVSLRATPAALTICDDQGRVLVVDPLDGTLLRNLRLKI